MAGGGLRRQVASPDAIDYRYNEGEETYASLAW